MKPRGAGNDIAVWNILHDGSIVSLEGTIPGDVRATVEVEYLRAMLPEPGDSFLVLLTECRLLEYRRSAGDEPLLTDPGCIAAERPEILSAQQLGDTVVISMTRGAGSYVEVRLQYESLSVSVENGRVVSLQELADASRQYWERFRTDG